MRDPFLKWFGVSIVVVAIALTLMVLVLLGHGAVIAYPLRIVLQLVPLMLYLALPAVLIVAAWRWAAAMLRELRAIRKDLDRIAAAGERQQQPR